ncbi:anti-sigma factor domain-containing protein [Paracoccus aerius]
MAWPDGGGDGGLSSGPGPAGPVAPTPEVRLVALLAHEGSNVHYMAVYDTDDGEVGLSHLSGNPAAGQDFELWVIQDPQQAPVSLGVIRGAARRPSGRRRPHPRPGRGRRATGHHP